MFLSDCHTHTRFSPDSEALVPDVARAAKAAGLDALCLTDHLDFLDFNGNFVGLGGHTMPFYDPGELARLAPAGLKLYSGVELGEPWADPALAAQVAQCPGLDFILGSAHNLGQEHGGQDFYFVHYDSEETCYEILDAYVGRLEALSTMLCFDSLAHVIYPLRYMNDRDGNHVSLQPYYPRLEHIFCTLIGQGRSIELNTTRGGAGGALAAHPGPLQGLRRGVGHPGQRRPHPPGRGQGHRPGGTAHQGVRSHPGRL